MSRLKADSTVAGISLIAVAAVWLWIANQADAPTVNSDLTVETQQMLVDGFKYKKQDAKVWGGMLEGLGRFVMGDGKTDQPIIKTVADIDKLRRCAVMAALDAVDGGDVVGRALSIPLAELGSGELTPAKRQQAAEIFINAGQLLGAL